MMLTVTISLRHPFCFVPLWTRFGKEKNRELGSVFVGEDKVSRD
jgi:hypothetical protein